MVELNFIERKKGIILDEYDYRYNFEELVSSVNNKIEELKKTDDLSKFVHKCKDLGNNLDKHRKECIKCYEGEFVQSHLNFDTAIHSLLSEVTNYGGCPRHWRNEDDDRINLIGELNKFCEEKESYKSHLKKLGIECQEKTKCNKTKNCNTKQLGYKLWLREKQNHFRSKQPIINEYFSGPNPKIKLLYDCNTSNSSLFEDNTNYCNKCVPTESAPNDVANSQYFVTKGIHTFPADNSQYIINDKSDLNYTSQRYGLGNILYYGDILGYNEYDDTHTVTLKDSSCTDNTYNIVQVSPPKVTQTVHDKELSKAREISEVPAAFKLSDVSTSSKISDPSESSESSDPFVSSEPFVSPEPFVSSVPFVPSVSSHINGVPETEGSSTLYHYSEKQLPHKIEPPEPSQNGENIMLSEIELPEIVPEAEEMSVKMYFIIIIIIMAIITLAINLIKYTPLRRKFQKKPKENLNDLETEFQKTLLKGSLEEEKNIYLPYTHL
ncbi:unnamed protein product [Plasmodium vivax]|uniref:(malaria parasite P. vivax) hypothetical protein n=2 Tax=Plasmodium vivax TaxID=5855 RepID=A0A8S4HC33_PLAVI|nr:unnamed protein product [Plasmodium vivax]